jgi:cobalt-zinc-cadmium efflux system membrane fusion protein
MNNRKTVLFITLSTLITASLAALQISCKPAREDAAKNTPLAAAEPSDKGAPREAGKEIQLTPEQMKTFGIKLDIAKAGKLQAWLNLSGDVAINTDRVAHIVPRVTGVVREVRKTLGESVRQGEVMAVLDSRELADCKAAFLAARQRVALAESNFAREEQLWKKKISAEQDYIQTGNALAETRIELQNTEQKLRTLGLSNAQMSELRNQPSKELTRYEMMAPFDGTIVEKHIDLGEVLKDDTPGFKIADLTTVWGNMDVQQRDIPYLHVGRKAVVSGGHGIPDLATTVSYIEPLANEQTRTVHARVLLPNRDGRWHPGMFITCRIAVEDFQAAVLVPNEALIMIEGKTSVFVQSGRGFRAQPVSTGQTGDTHTEITSGLNAGQTYVAQGAFVLKSEMDKPKNED